MKKKLLGIAIAGIAACVLAVRYCLEDESDSELVLWYTSPATDWQEYALPIGNGQLGASLFGGVECDRILFNEKTLWTGGIGTSGDYAHYGDSVVYGSYQVFGNLYAYSLDDYSEGADSTVLEYERSLDLERGIGKVKYISPDGKNDFRREYFVSYPDQCIVAHYKCNGRDGINLRFVLESGRPGVDAATTYGKDGGWFSGTLNTVSYAAAFKIDEKGGEITSTDDGIEVREADEITVVLMAATDYDPYSDTYTSGTDGLLPGLRQTLKQTMKLPYKKLKRRHTDDFEPLMHRVSLDLGGKSALPTDSLVNRYATADSCSAEALKLEELYFHYGRYLEIASSRGVDLPSNLQGIWNNTSTAPWHSDIHANINVQMNYWPAEAGNMSEMHRCFANYIWNMACNHPEWQDNARTYAGQTQGWTMFTENNIFGGGSVFATNYVIANAWYCTHLWQHYRYTLDREFLVEKALPAMWGACQFWMQRLVVADDGTYECPDEYSPEQGPYRQNATAHSQQLVADLFANTIKAIEVAGSDSPIGNVGMRELKEKYARLDKGLAIETYDGKWGEDRIASGTPILREWKYSPYSAGEHNHRHASHLLCLYPFSQVTPASGALFEAAVNSMKLRGDASTGWSMGWKINLWARALDGNRAHKVLRTALQHSKGYKGGIYYNLFDSHPPFQIDGNFGATAGIIEMCLQSHTDTIQLLPALPQAWQNGTMTGLKATGGYTVDQQWDNGSLTRATITALHGGVCPIRYKGLAQYTVRLNGKTITTGDDDTATAETNAGDLITIERNDK